MKFLSRSWVLWTFTIVFTLSISVYQRLTGPTKPVIGRVALADETIRYRLLRSHETGSDAAVRVKATDPAITGTYQFRRFKSHDQWEERPMLREGEYLYAYIPSQLPAGKVMYQITLSKDDIQAKLTEEPVIMRFKGVVPIAWLLPHIIFMFIAMLFSTRTGLEAIFKRNETYTLSLITVIALFFGGIILGPIIQKFAFGAYWTGWPVGTDLTDNKTAVAFFLWIVAVVRLWKNREKRGWALIASIVMLVVYLIPHSLLGSEIDYTAQ